MYRAEDVRVSGLDMAFQVVELSLDASDNVVDRRAIPYANPARDEPVDTIDCQARPFFRRGSQSSPNKTC